MRAEADRELYDKFACRWEELKRAANAAAVCWEDLIDLSPDYADAVRDYPPEMPSFDEFATILTLTSVPEFHRYLGRRVVMRWPHPISNYETAQYELGTVVEWEKEQVSIRLDVTHDDLDEWGNCLVWYGPDTEDNDARLVAYGEIVFLDDLQAVVQNRAVCALK